MDGKLWTKEKENRRKKTSKTSDEELLDETKNDNDQEKDLDEEITLMGSKNAGHMRTNPQEPSDLGSKSSDFFQCPHCTYRFETKTMLDVHIRTHHTNDTSFK